MSHLFCSFVANERLYGLPIAEVQELIRPQLITPIPLASEEIFGLINLRGQVVPSIDLRSALGHPPRAPGDGFMNVVTRTPYGPVAIIVDAVADVVQADDDQLEDVPDTVAKHQRAFLQAACKLPERLLLVLSLGHLTRLRGARNSDNAGSR